MDAPEWPFGLNIGIFNTRFAIGFLFAGFLALILSMVGFWDLIFLFYLVCLVGLNLCYSIGYILRYR